MKSFFDVFLILIFIFAIIFLCKKKLKKGWKMENNNEVCLLKFYGDRGTLKTLKNKFDNKEFINEECESELGVCLEDNRLTDYHLTVLYTDIKDFDLEFIDICNKLKLKGEYKSLNMRENKFVSIVIKKSIQIETNNCFCDKSIDLLSLDYFIDYLTFGIGEYKKDKKVFKKEVKLLKQYDEDLYKEIYNGIK